MTTKEHRSGKYDRQDHAQAADYAFHFVCDHFIHIAYSHDMPVAVLKGVDGVNHIRLDVRPVLHIFLVFFF